MNSAFRGDKSLMTILPALLKIGTALYVHILQRTVLRIWARQYHSKSFIQKMKKEAPFPARVTCTYLLRDSKFQRRDIKRYLLILNINLLGIPLAILLLMAGYSGILVKSQLDKIYAFLFLVDGIMLLHLYVLCRLHKHTFS